MATWDDVQAGMKVNVKGQVWNVVGRSGGTFVMTSGSARREGKPKLDGNVEIVGTPQPTPPVRRAGGVRRTFETPEQVSKLEPTPQKFSEGVDTDPSKMDSDWSRVYPGYHVKGKDGLAWRVLERTKDEGGFLFTLARPGREPVTRHAKGKVVLMFVDKVSEDQATALLVQELGADVLAERVSRDPVLRVPPFRRAGPKLTLDRWKIHMKMLHGIYADDLKSLDAMRELHESDDALTLGSLIPHVHLTS